MCVCVCVCVCLCVCVCVCVCVYLSSDRAYFSYADVRNNNCHTKQLNIPYDVATGILLCVNVTYSYPNNLLINIVNVRHKLKNNITPGVYIIPCNGCGHVYVGQTGRNL